MRLFWANLPLQLLAGLGAQFPHGKTLREALTDPLGPMRTHLGAVHERMGKE